MPSEDVPFWGQPDGRFADDLLNDGPTKQPGGGSYDGIPPAENGEFSTFEDAPGPSVPPALDTSPATLPVQAPPLVHAKDND